MTLIVVYEMRADWPQIVEAIDCPMCCAKAGEKCRNMGAIPGTLFHKTPRSDYHADRKVFAIEHYKQLQQASEETTAEPPVEPPAEEPKSEGENAQE